MASTKEEVSTNVVMQEFKDRPLKQLTWYQILPGAVKSLVTELPLE